MHAIRTSLADGRRHFQHGPIDCIVAADGDPAVVATAHDAAWCRFETVLDELVAELPALKAAVGGDCPLAGDVARRMWHACRPYATDFITPMAAVAGAVADTLIASFRVPGIERAWVNNGGDIAIHLGAGASLRVGLYADLARFDVARWGGRVDVDGRFTLSSPLPWRGVATSGWRGRSFSRGVADAVTVVADTAADADAAATMIGNAVDVDHPSIVRRPASSMKDDSDLGDCLVTVDVPPLDAASVGRALGAGLDLANRLRHEGRIAGCVIVFQGRHAAVGPVDRWLDVSPTMARDEAGEMARADRTGQAAEPPVAIASTVSFAPRGAGRTVAVRSATIAAGIRGDERCDVGLAARPASERDAAAMPAPNFFTPLVPA